MRNFDDFTQVAVDYTDDGFLKLKIKYYVAEEVKGSKWLASVTPDKYNYSIMGGTCLASTSQNRAACPAWDPAQI